MTYTVAAVQAGDELWQVDVAITDADAETVVRGKTHVCVQTEEEALEYGERVFLPDLRHNDKRLADLVLDWEEPVEVAEGGEPA
jgi:hypothetical protein